MLEYDEVEMVSTESVVTKVKKNDGNVFMSLFSSITKSLGIGEWMTRGLTTTTLNTLFLINHWFFISFLSKNHCENYEDMKNKHYTYYVIISYQLSFLS